MLILIMINKINNFENAVSSTPQKIIKQNCYRAQNDRKKSMRKFNDSIFDYISFFASKLGLNLQKCYIKQLYGKNKDENALFIQKNIKDIIIESVPRRIPKKGNKMINKQLIDKLYNREEIDEEKNSIKFLLITLLEKTVEEMYNKYIMGDKIIGDLNLENYENKYQHKFKTFNDDNERIDNKEERKKYECNAKNLIKAIKNKKGDFIGRPKARGKKIKRKK